MKTSNSSNFINGRWVIGGGCSFQSISPSSSEIVWSGNAASGEDVVEAIEAAAHAQKTWGKLPFDDRVEYLKRFEGIVRKERENLAKIISREMGKPFWESLTEADAVADKLKPSLEAYQNRRNTAVRPLPVGQSVTRFVPHGVALVIGPFNFPAHMANGHIIPALLAGNTIVLKPSDTTPAVASAYVEYWRQAGLPDGVINLLQGGAEVAKQAISDPRVNAVFFTGSRDAGVAINRLLADQPWRMAALEMGGNNSLVVWDYDDVNFAVYTAIVSSFVTSGQRCTSARKLIVRADDSVFLEEFTRAASRLTVGNPLAESQPFMGPMASVAKAEKLINCQDALIARGGRSLLSMKRADANSAYVSPGIIEMTGIPNGDDAEIFGPLLIVVRVSSLDEAIGEANSTHYGLASAIICKERLTYEKFVGSVCAGIINWNQQLTGATPLAAFGGLKESGNHRPSGYFAADYCASPVASIEVSDPVLPKQLLPGVAITGH